MRIIYLLLAAVVYSGAVSALDLDNGRSTLNFLSVKNGSVAEVGGFKSLAGSLDKKGNLSLMIDLGSLDTNIALRDERMLEFLFEVANFPQARVSAKVNMAGISAMTAGDERPLEVQGQLELHGATHAVQASLRLVKLADGSLRATTVAPILLQASQFKLDAGVEKLRELAGLDSIDVVVPVYFSLVFAP